MDTTEMGYFAEALKNEIIKVYVGEDTANARPYLIPSTILRRYRYFRKLLSPPFVESQTGILHFPEDTERAWSVLLYYLFNDRIEWSGMADADIRPNSNIITLAHAYAAADKYGLARLQNKIARTMMNGVMKELHFAPSAIEEAMSLLPAECPLRWIILEKVVLLVKGRYSVHTWTDFEGLLQFANVFGDLMTCFEIYNADEEVFPPYARGTSFVHGQKCMKKYFVDESNDV